MHPETLDDADRMFEDGPEVLPRLSLNGAELRSWEYSSSVEWLVTNGIGGYASGTAAGSSSRRYHGHLMAALHPPVGRSLLVGRMDDSVQLGGASYALGSSQWWDQSISPRGFERLESFELELGLPVFRYDVGGFALTRRIWMEDRSNVTWVTYRWPDDAPSAVLMIRPLLAQRDFHSLQRGSSECRWHTTSRDDGADFWCSNEYPRTVFRAAPVSCYHPENQWYWGHLYEVERERGLDSIEDLWAPGSLELPLVPGESAALLISAGETRLQPTEHAAALKREQHRRIQLLGAPERPAEESALRLSADSFLVRRPVRTPSLPELPNTVIAGYHWFADWGRDTMISLPGLTLTTGRFPEARDILTSYAGFISEGMLPNQFPDSGASPEYNTVDATLWYFQAIRSYVEASGDRTLIPELWPGLCTVIECHLRGTRHGIQADPVTGMLRAGEEGSQLTWMDAKVGSWVVTPRVGMPVEIVALWYNALRLMQEWSLSIQMSASVQPEPSPYREVADRIAASFAKRFWIQEGGYLCDVVETPSGDDRSFRPNQLFAASLPYPLLDPEKAAAVVTACQQRLLTPCGLRTLDPADPRYVGHYLGDPGQRDGAYHQGTVWAWLIGPFVDALLYATGDVNAARAAAEPLLLQTRTAGIGALSEIFDGDPPHTPRGCIAQAWSVAETLRALQRVGPPALKT